MKKFHVSLRFLVTIITILIIGISASIAIFLAKGYRFSPQKGNIITGTGIMSITSIPDQASVYLDSHLTTATNANINSLTPKKYHVKIVKDGYIAWEKDVEVNEGLVTDIKATLFPAIPTIYPLTFNGVINTVLSPDSQKLVFVISGTDPKKSGVWIWTMSEKPIGFARGSEPHQIAKPLNNIDFTKATLKFSPDSTQVLVTLPDQSLLLDVDRLNDTPRDITAILQPTTKGWVDETATKNKAQIDAIKDLKFRKIASESATIQWSPDESKFYYTDQKTDVINSEKIIAKVVDLVEKKTYNLPPANSVIWLADSRHLILVDKQGDSSDKPEDNIKPGKISVVEFDGNNQSILYAGNFNLGSVYPWPDGSRLVLITSFPTPTAEQPNLYGINLK